jgi:hypothetical protein
MSHIVVSSVQHHFYIFCNNWNYQAEKLILRDSVGPKIFNMFFKMIVKFFSSFLNKSSYDYLLDFCRYPLLKSFQWDWENIFTTYSGKSFHFF